MKLTFFTLIFTLLAIASFYQVNSKGLFGGGFRGGSKGGGFKPAPRPRPPSVPHNNRPPSVPHNNRPPSVPHNNRPPTVVIHSKPSRPNVIIYRPSRPGIVVIRPRPVTHRIIILPVYHPRPLYSIYLPLYISSHSHTTTHQEQPKPIAESSCTKNGVSIFSYCQQKVQAQYPLNSLNSTARSCCSSYAELGCYIDHAGEYCSVETDAKSLMEHSKNVAEYFGSTICRSVPRFSTWKSVCSEIPQLEATFSANTTEKVDFIEAPAPATTAQKDCFTKMKTAKEGDLTKVCLNATLNVWDTNRRKLYSSAIYEPCCSMYDMLDCLEVQAEHLCTEFELAEMRSYQVDSKNAFSSGICREVPYSQAGPICRGEASTGAAFAVQLPSIFVALIAASAAVMFANY